MHQFTSLPCLIWWSWNTPGGNHGTSCLNVLGEGGSRIGGYTEQVPEHSYRPCIRVHSPQRLVCRGMGAFPMRRSLFFFFLINFIEMFSDISLKQNFTPKREVLLFCLLRPSPIQLGGGGFLVLTGTAPTPIQFYLGDSSRSWPSSWETS